MSWILARELQVGQDFARNLTSSGTDLAAGFTTSVLRLMNDSVRWSVSDDLAIWLAQGSFLHDGSYLTPLTDHCDATASSYFGNNSAQPATRVVSVTTNEWTPLIITGDHCRSVSTRLRLIV